MEKKQKKTKTLNRTGPLGPFPSRRLPANPSRRPSLLYAAAAAPWYPLPLSSLSPTGPSLSIPPLLLSEPCIEPARNPTRSPWPRARPRPPSTAPSSVSPASTDAQPHSRPTPTRPTTPRAAHRDPVPEAATEPTATSSARTQLRLFLLCVNGVYCVCFSPLLSSMNAIDSRLKIPTVVSLLPRSIKVAELPSSLPTPSSLPRFSLPRRCRRHRAGARPCSTPALAAAPRTRRTKPSSALAVPTPFVDRPPSVEPHRNSRCSSNTRHPWRLAGVRPRRSPSYLAIRTLTDTLLTKTAVHSKVKNNPNPLMYFLNCV
jgi:hypothetical protein